MTVHSVFNSNCVSSLSADVLVEMKNAALGCTISFPLPLLVVSSKCFSTFVTKSIAAPLDSPCSTKCSIAAGKSLFFLRLLTASSEWPVLGSLVLSSPFFCGTS